jgi:hypothetical protein
MTGYMVSSEEVRVRRAGLVKRLIFQATKHNCSVDGLDSRVAGQPDPVPVGCSSASEEVNPEYRSGTQSTCFLDVLAACIITIDQRTLRDIHVACGNMVAVCRTMERAGFMPDNFVAQSSFGQLLTRKCPSAQNDDYLKQANQGRGS